VTEKPTNGALLARIDERTNAIARDLDGVKKDIHALRKDNKDQYVTKDQFAPVQRITYGLAGSVLLAFLAGLAKMIGWR